MTKITCKSCGKTYAYQLFGMVYPGAKERETADCPYCGETGYSKMTSQAILVYKLDENGEIISK